MIAGNPNEERRIIEKIEKNCSDIALTKTIAQKLIYMYLKLKHGISTIIMGETGVGKTCLVRYLSQMLQSLVFTLDVHAGRTQKEIIQWIRKVIDLSKLSFKDLQSEHQRLINDTNK